MTARRPGKRRENARRPGARRVRRAEPPRTRRRSRRWLWLLGALLGAGLGLVSALLVWSIVPPSAPPDAGPVIVHLDSAERAPAIEHLAAAGLVDKPGLMRLYLGLLLPTVEFVPGEHLLRHGLSPRDLSARLGRLPRRATAKVVVPEGWHRKKIAQRLEKAEVCPASSFLAATESPELLAELALEGPPEGLSAEGYLFAATYDFSVDTGAKDVVRRMVKETRRRLVPLFAKHPGALERLREAHGFGERELLTLGSIIEKETARGSERALIASVFLNRLAAQQGETRGRLQSDPTAAYGCEYEAERAPSCASFDGRIQPAMLRDSGNRYNTYRHAGLPPGPIASPGLDALEAVLAPADSDYLFFVADGSGSHAFSRTFEEHQSAVARLRAARAPASQPSE